MLRTENLSQVQDRHIDRCGLVHDGARGLGSFNAAPRTNASPFGAVLLP